MEFIDLITHVFPLSHTPVIRVLFNYARDDSEEERDDARQAGSPGSLPHTTEVQNPHLRLLAHPPPGPVLFRPLF